MYSYNGDFKQQGIVQRKLVYITHELGFKYIHPDDYTVLRETEERISHLLSTYKALQILFPNTVIADAWIRKPNRFFDGRSALDVMLEGKLSDIIAVRNYVDAQRGG